MIKNLPEKLKKVFTVNTDSPYYYLGVLAIALLIFGFSFYQTQSNINNPFKIGQARYENVDIPAGDEVDLEDAEALKKIDTDKDGLSDYLELYVYGTSAYIEDTDSDGISDKMEVVSGANPLCANPDGCNVDIFSGTPADQNNDNDSVVKQNLIDLGFVASDLESLSSDELAQLYEQANIALLQSSGASADNSVSTETSSYIMSVEELKSALMQEGVTAEELSAISDDQLMEMYNQVLQETQKS